MIRARAVRFAVAALAAALVASACSSDDDSDDAERVTRDLSDAAAASFDAHGSVEQVWVTGAEPGVALELVASEGAVVAFGEADDEGSLILRGVEPGDEYRVATVAATEGDAPVQASETLAVGAPDDHPSADFYADQEIATGYGYLETRDGTLLAINVTLPGPVEDGPYPTVIEYSGYDPANPEEAEPGSLIAGTLGYATVGVNVRGTGCSGGAFQFFETLQSTDGYDVVETIAAQPWVEHGTVGMVGISYPGIAQLFVAATQPPHLAAITPLSVIGDTARGTLYPGGILNSGFATEWAEERKREAEPGGQEWAQRRIDAGDETCAQNQRLRGQNPDIIAMIEDNQYWTDEIAAPLAPELFVDRIDVPVFMAGAFQDEQTGGYFANMIDEFADNPQAWFTLTNGGHTDSLGPEIFSRYMEFLSLFVAREVPRRAPTAGVVVSTIGGAIFGTDVALPPERFTDVTDYDEAVERFESDPRVRVLFENGAGGAPGAPVPTFEAGFDAWPLPGTTETAWYFDEAGALVSDAPDEAAADSYRYDTSRAQVTTFSGGTDEVWRALPEWQWPAPLDGASVAYETDALDAPVVMVGGGSVDLWIRSDGPDADLQATITEVRPDGQEVYVQSGWLRASHRALADDATELRPRHSHTEADAADLPGGEFVEARVELFPFAHVFRAGSRVRIVVEAPGASRPRWKFDAVEPVAGQRIEIGRGGAQASRVVLPVLDGLDAPDALPPCPSLRGQPCRDYVEVVNAAGDD
ncbi:MAG TPA: CocE/NonD family hydrolase [Acidimicrobiia bacterium]|nr:CocE/NonD family hydrolase [Acidimicrobiia bacterium]